MAWSFDRGGLTRLVGRLILWLLIATTSVQAQDRTGPPSSRLLLDFQLGRISHQLAFALSAGDTLALPAETILTLAEFRVQRAGRKLRVSLPGQRPLMLDGGSGRATVAGKEIATGLIEVDSVVYAPLELLTRVLGTDITVDLDQATVAIAPADHLPAVQRRTREDARRQWAAERAGGPGPLAQLASRTGWSGLAFEYDVRTSGFGRSGSTAYSTGIATRIAGGTGSFRVVGTDQEGASLRGDWSLIRPSDRWLTQLHLGDGQTAGPRPEAHTGFLLTNAPPFRRLEVERLPFAGALPPGWSVEAYRAGRLVAFDSVGAGGRYSMELPIQYGENPVDLVAYGPFGEIRTFNQTFRLLPTALPNGAVEYALSAGRCRTSRCRWAVQADLRAGLTRRLTVRGGAAFRRSIDGLDRWSPEIGAVAAPFNAVGLDLEAVAREFARAGVRYEPSIRLLATAEYVRYARGASGYQFAPPGRWDEWRVYGRADLGRNPGRLVAETSVNRSRDSSGASTEVRGGVITRAGGLLVRPYAGAVLGRPTPAAGRGFVGLELDFLPNQVLGPLLDQLWIQTISEIGFDGEPRSVRLLANRELTRHARLEGGISWQRGLPGHQLSLGLTTQLPSVRYAARAVAHSRSPGASVVQAIGGSAFWDRAGGRVIFHLNPPSAGPGYRARSFSISMPTASGTRASRRSPARGSASPVGRW